MSDYKDLKVWSYSHDFVLKVYKETSTFPNKEKYGLVSQLRRAAASIPTNIAEGTGSSSSKRFCNFVDIARGSAQEVEYLLLLSKDLEYISEEKYKELDDKCTNILRMLTKLRKSLAE
ncbi:MAG: four helix bundle protein [Bacillota bacterium]